MKEDTKDHIINGLKSIPIGVAIGIITGLMFGFGVGCIVCGLTTYSFCVSHEIVYLSNKYSGC